MQINTYGWVRIACFAIVLVVGAKHSEAQEEPAGLPATPHAYSDSSVLPMHFTDPMYPFGAIATADNETVDNMATDAGATLGRVLFYDRRLSANDSVSCASCHRQETGFTDPRPLSIGFNGGVTGRHSMVWQTLDTTLMDVCSGMKELRLWKLKCFNRFKTQSKWV